MKEILIIDYGVGNIQSVGNALRWLGYDFVVSRKKQDIVHAGLYIFPGVGAFEEGMRNLQQFDLIETLQEQVLQYKKPILGICLGMQLLAEDSEEKGSHRGLGWIPGHVVYLSNGSDLRIPHVGWNTVTVKKHKPLFQRVGGEATFYFDHSYHFTCDAAYIAGVCGYGTDIVAAVQRDNIFGVQFHPEKSQNAGLKLLRSFLDYHGFSHA